MITVLAVYIFWQYVHPTERIIFGTMVAPTMSRIVQQMKGYITKRIGFAIFQKLFFDHVIRNQQDYEEHLKYIYENPLRIDHHE